MEKPFRVVIVGGGLIGLLAAHILLQEGIEYVVLEQRAALVLDGGASIGLYPQTARILDQLGLLEAIQRIWNPLSRKIVTTHKGAIYKDHPRFEWMRENHGHPFAMIHRADLVQTLYKTLPAYHQQGIKTSKRVVGIKVSERGAEVHCSDNSIGYGSMIIGADGVASQVRHLMKNINRDSNLSPVDDERAQFPSSFSLMYGAVPVLPGMPVGTSWEAHGTGMATQLFVGSSKAWFFWYEKLQHTSHERIRYSKVDEAKFVERWAHVHVTDKIVLKDVYAARLSSGMTLVEEGIARDWHHNRIVLVGDAAVKVSPNLAFGFNGGLQGLVSLANGLNRLLHSVGGSVLSTAELDNVFRAYQSEMKPISTKLSNVSGKSLRMISCETWQDWLYDRFVSGATGEDWKRYHEDFAPMISRSLVLYFLEERHMPKDRMPWLRHPDTRGERSSV